MIPMAPIVILMLARILSYITENAEEVAAAIKERFPIANTDPEVSNLIQELGYEPTEDKLNSLHDVLKAKGENPAELAALLVNKTIA